MLGLGDGDIVGEARGGIHVLTWSMLAPPSALVDAFLGSGIKWVGPTKAALEAGPVSTRHSRGASAWTLTYAAGRQSRICLS